MPAFYTGLAVTGQHNIPPARPPLLSVTRAIGTMRFEIISIQNLRGGSAYSISRRAIPGKLLISALGFPGIVEQVVNFVDEAASRFESTKAQTLMASHKLLFAFSHRHLYTKA